MKRISLLLWAVLFYAAIPLLATSDYHVQLATQLLIFSILFIGVDIAVGHAGLVSVAHGALFGVGAYATAILTVDHGVSFWWSLPASIAAAVVCGLVIHD